MPSLDRGFCGALQLPVFGNAECRANREQSSNFLFTTTIPTHSHSIKNCLMHKKQIRSKSLDRKRGGKGRLPWTTCTPHSIIPWSPDNVYLFEQDNARLFLTTPSLLHGSAQQSNPSFQFFSLLAYNGGRLGDEQRWGVGTVARERDVFDVSFCVFCNFYMIAVACRATQYLYHWAMESPKKSGGCQGICSATAKCSMYKYLFHHAHVWFLTENSVPFGDFSRWLLSTRKDMVEINKVPFPLHFWLFLSTPSLPPPPLPSIFSRTTLIPTFSILFLSLAPPNTPPYQTN